MKVQFRLRCEPKIMPMPPEMEDKLLTWPNLPLKLRTSSSQEEGCERDFAVATKRFTGENGTRTASGRRIRTTPLPCLNDGVCRSIRGANPTLPRTQFRICPG